MNQKDKTFKNIMEKIQKGDISRLSDEDCFVCERQKLIPGQTRMDSRTGRTFQVLALLVPDKVFVYVDKEGLSVENQKKIEENSFVVGMDDKEITTHPVLGILHKMYAEEKISPFIDGFDE